MNIPVKDPNKSKSFELKLGPYHLLFFIGVEALSLVLAFYLGMVSGHKFGIESTLSAGLSSMTQSQIGRQADSSEKVVSEDPFSADEAAPKELESLDTSKSPEPPKNVTVVAATPVAAATGLVAVGHTKAQSKNSQKERDGVTPIREAEIPEEGSVPSEGNGGSTFSKVLDEKAKEIKKPVEDRAQVVDIPGSSTAETSAQVTGSRASFSITKKEDSLGNAKFDIKPNPGIQRKSSAALEKGFYAQVISTPGVSEGEALASNLRNGGFPVTIEETLLEGKKMYRVLVGPEVSRETGARLIEQLKREKYIQGAPFLKVVK